MLAAYISLHGNGGEVTASYRPAQALTNLWRLHDSTVTLHVIWSGSREEDRRNEWED